MPKKINIDILDRIGKPKDMVDQLLNNQVEQVESKLGSQFKGIGNKILSLFVQNGNRLQLSADDVSHSIQQKIKEDEICLVLDKLVDEGLLNHAGDNRYEIANNVLAQRAYQKVEGTNLLLRQMEAMIRNRIERNVLLDEDDLNYLENSLDLLELTDAEREFVKQSKDAIRKKRRRLYFLMILAFSLLTTLTTWALINEQQTADLNERLNSVNDALREDTIRQNRLNAQLTQVRDSLNIKIGEAEASELEANYRRQEAEILQRESFRLQKEAELAAERARTAKGDADLQKLIAEQNANEANQLAKIAQQSEEEAQRLRQEAENAAFRAIAFNRIVISQNVATRSLQVENPKSQAIIALHTHLINEKEPMIGNSQHPYILKALYTACLNFNKSLDYSIPEIHAGAIQDIVYHPYLDIFYTIGSDGNILEWTVNQWANVGKPDLTFQTFAGSDNGALQNSAAMNAAGSLLLVGGELPLIQLFNTDSRQRIEIFPTNANVEIFQCGFLNSEQVVGFSKDSLYINQTGVDPLIIQKQPSKTNAIVPFNNRNYAIIYLGEEDTAIDGYTITRQLLDNNVMLESSLSFPGESFSDLSAVGHYQKQDTSLVAFGFDDGRLMLLKLNFNGFTSLEDQFIRNQNQAPISDFAFSNDGSFMAAASYDGTISVWDLAEYTDPSYLPMVFDLHSGWALAVAFSKDSKYVLVGDQEGSITFWNLDPNAYAEQLCEDLLASSNNPNDYRISNTEWQTYFGDAITQETICR